jgi:hypothetical protein
VFHRLIDEAIETEFGCDAGWVCISARRLIARLRIRLDVAARLEWAITVLGGEISRVISHLAAISRTFIAPVRVRKITLHCVIEF